MKEYGEEEYIIGDNDPEKVSIVSDDSIVTDDETIIKNDKVIDTLTPTSQFEINKHDFEREESILDFLNHRELKLGVSNSK